VVTAGVTFEYTPKWEGSKHFRVEPLPYNFGVRRADEPDSFSAPDDGLDFAIIDTPTFKLGPVFGVREGRDVSKYGKQNCSKYTPCSNTGAELTGFDNYSWAIEGGAFAEYWLMRDFLRTRVEVVHGLRYSDGLTANVSADVVKKYGRLTLSGGPRVVLADSNIMQMEFGVSPDAAARRKISTYNPTGGVESVGASFAQNYALSDAWNFILYQRYDKLVGVAADSPIIGRLGTPDQFTVGAGVTYSLHLGH
jgi:outer membrane scaffolding protein for murein synthesis (MipA/OmpV family)